MPTRAALSPARRSSGIVSVGRETKIGRFLPAAAIGKPPVERCLGRLLAEIIRPAPLHGVPCTNDREVMPGSVSRVGRCRTSWRFARKVASRGLGNWLVK